MTRWSLLSMVRNLFPFSAVLFFIVLSPSIMAAQATNAAQPVPYASLSELNNLLDQVKQTSQNMQVDLAGTRIDRWRTDSSNKRQTQANVDSVQRNLQAALPEMMAQLNNSPEDLAATFKLYRNLDALYDVFGSVVESAGKYGSKDEFQGLSNDLSNLESERRSLGERMQRLAAAKEDELARLRTQIKTLQATMPPPPPKKIIVDDTEPRKKPAAKKKTAKPKSSSHPSSSPPDK